jgi:hypothetical protein
MRAKNYKQKQKKLEKEFQKILEPGIFTKEQLDERTNKGVEILAKLIDNDILCRLFELGNENEKL